LFSPSAVALGDSGRVLYVADQRGRILRINTAGVAEELLNHSTCTGNQCLRRPQGMIVHNNGLLIADDLAHRVWRFDLGTRFLTPFAGNGSNAVSADGVNAVQAPLSAPIDLDILPDGRVIFTELNANRIRVVGADGVLRTFAADIELPSGLAVAGSAVYVSQLGLDNVIELGTDGVMRRTVAGTGAPGFGGDGGPATEAALFSPRFLVVAGENLFISDRDNNRIRSVNLLTGIITTFAGTGATAFAGSGRAAAETALDTPAGLAYSDFGFLYIVDQDHHIVWRTPVRAGIL
jgi:serine/threonine-protein kinase